MPHYENDVPSNWAVCRLEDIAVIGTGATPDTRIDAYYNGNIPWINSSSTKGEYIEIPSSYISEKAISETNCQIYPSGSLIMAMYGEGKTRGQVSELRFDSATNQACAAIVPIDNQMKGFLKAYLKSNYYHIRTLAEGGNQPNLNLSKISQYIIPIPPIDEQVRIIAAIEKWFALIETLETAKEDLQTSIVQAKSKILDLAIHGKLVAQDPNDEPAIELLKRINPKFAPCDNAHYEDVPSNWTIILLGDLCFTINGLWKGKKPPFVNVGVIRNANFTKDCKLDYSNIAYLEVEAKQYEKRKLQFGDIIVEKSGGSDNQPVGRTILFEKTEGDYSFSNFTSVLRIHDSYPALPEYLNMYLQAVYQTGITKRMQTQTTGIHNLIFDQFLAIPIKLPPLVEQRRIINKVKELFQILDNISANL